MASEPGSGSELTAAERQRLAALRSARTLSDLVGITGADSEHGAYFAAKREWYDLVAKELADGAPPDGLPGDCVSFDGRRFCVHGITHADTVQEGEFLREHVSRLLEDGAAVYCEQGIRSMYFSAFPDVCQMDDYRWATDRCRTLEVDSHLSELAESGFEGLTEDVDSIAARLQDAVFSLIDSGSDLYGDQFTAALGDVASHFLMSHEDMATGDDFESFTKTRQAAVDPRKLVELQRYYEKRFLPQPVEREWLRRHDPELELLTHARNERMADYVVHRAEAGAVHLIVGAAHQPGVVYYLERYRDGHRQPGDFEPCW